ncbi:MAG: transposase [Acidobacteria bacterium]|nr:transposase [Acidobacteriota bacterium]
MGGHSYCNVLVHAIFSTKMRRNSIPADKLEALWRYFGGIARHHKISLLRAGGTRNHAHLLFALPSTQTIADVIGTFKSNSSRWVSPIFEWQSGYGAFSVSVSNREKVIAYIDHQEKHYREMTFDEEFLAFLKKAGVDYDPRFVLG